MKFPINTADGVAFTLRAAGYDKHCYLNALNGGGHFPTTAVMEIYALPSCRTTTRTEQATCCGEHAAR